MREMVKKFSTATIFDKKLIIIYALNVSDYILTLLLLNSGLFAELNPLLSIPINNFWGFVLKCIVPLGLLLVVRHRLRDISTKQIKPVWYILDFTIGLYAIINIFHVFWLIMTTFYLIPLTEQIIMQLSNTAH